MSPPLAPLRHAGWSEDVCCLGQSGRHPLGMSISHFDPQRTLEGHRDFVAKGPGVSAKYLAGVAPQLSDARAAKPRKPL